MTTTAKETRSEGEAKDIDILLDSAKRVYKTSQWEKEYALTKERVKLVNIFWINNDTLPFYLLAFCLTIDTNRIPAKEIMATVLKAVRPIRELFDSLQGVMTKLVSNRTCTPFLMYLGLDHGLELVYSSLDTLKISSTSPLPPLLSVERYFVGLIVETSTQ
jgi:hypothetical protein